MQRKVSGKFFTDLSLPNNHPLHSLLMKYSIAIFSYSISSLRIPAFIAGVMLLFSIPTTTFLLTKNKLLSLLSLAIVVFNGGLIHYSQTARGYSMQCLFISLFILFIIYIESDYRKPSFLSYFLFISPILSILTLSTSVMFLFPICLLHIIFLCKKNYKPNSSMNDLSPRGGVLNPLVGIKIILKRIVLENLGIVCSYTLLTLFVLFWYSYNLEAFQGWAIFWH